MSIEWTEGMSPNRSGGATSVPPAGSGAKPSLWMNLSAFLVPNLVIYSQEQHSTKFGLPPLVNGNDYLPSDAFWMDGCTSAHMIIYTVTTANIQ